MLRWMMPIVVATFALTSAAEAVGPAGKAAARRAASQLPAGLPRAHYKFRTTITRATPAPYLRPAYVADGPEVPFAPSDGYVPYLPPAVGVAWWPGYPAWSGYWGLPFGYNYQSPWYAGPESRESNLQPYGYGCGYGLYGYGYC
ncbi:hypothetical protein KMZ93_12985 [Bradyrhizobium sediminis]|uniref:Uncharacterized protein n=1 Tax=Bradyrhizobium sediminis TaxID=2840469 RepID=A0A975P410_9BRAD|nr:hypothetical protein [Bradyrhizobium sediminis]QWG25719.1 hypothetical protein KMZ93_12985 [Bradyrhizobium sediminis]